LQNKVVDVEQSLSSEDEKANLTDRDACFQKGKKGNFDLFYNVQVGCNEQQVILHASVCKDANDRQQLQPGIEGVEKNTKQKVEKAIADAGYSSFNNMEYLKKNGIEGFIPDQDLGKKFKDQPYHKFHFKEDKEDKENDELICPAGKRLKYHRESKENKNTFKVYKGISCDNCPVKSLCTKAKARTVRIEVREPLQEEMRERLESDEGKMIYKKRFHPVESIFGHLKFNLGYYHFLLRGLDKVNAEFYLMCLTYNLAKLFKKTAILIRFTAISSLMMHPIVKLYCYPSLSKNFLYVILLPFVMLLHIV